MHKKLGFKFASITVSTADGDSLAPKLANLLWDYAGKMRSSVDMVKAFDFATFMLYCSYVSRNAEDLGIVDLDMEYSIDEVKENLGNKYVAGDFIQKYAALKAGCNLPDLSKAAFDMPDLSKAIVAWCDALNSSGLSLMEGDDTFSAAKTIQDVLMEVASSDRWPGSYRATSSSRSISELVVKLADVEGKSVLDFACGDGVFLSCAEANGAASVFGRDIDPAAVVRSKIFCFFANPTCPVDVRTADALQPDASFPGVADRILVAPPMGMQLREGEGDTLYFAQTYQAALGELPAYSRHVEDFFVAKALASLDVEGMAVLHVSASFLFHQQKGRQALRRALVEGGYIRTVIELPGGCIPGTSVKSALLVLGKDKGDGVFIVDLDSKELAGKGYVNKGRGKCEITDEGIEWLVGVVKIREEIDMVSTFVPSDEALEGDCNLCYSAHGAVYDFASALEARRSAAEIQNEANEAHGIINELSEQIGSILAALEKRGE